MRAAGGRRRTVCHLLLPTRDEAVTWAPRNRISEARFWECVLAQFEWATRAFAEPHEDVVVVAGADQPRLAAMLHRLQDFRVVVCARAPDACPAADPSTKLLVWCHTPVRQACPVAVRVHLEDVTARPRVQLCTDDPIFLWPRPK